MPSLNKLSWIEYLASLQRDLSETYKIFNEQDIITPTSSSWQLHPILELDVTITRFTTSKQDSWLLLLYKLYHLNGQNIGSSFFSQRTIGPSLNISRNCLNKTAWSWTYQPPWLFIFAAYIPFLVPWGFNCSYQPTFWFTCYFLKSALFFH